MSFFIPLAHADAGVPAPGQPGGDLTTMLLMFAAFGVFFYLFIFRPQSKKAREHRNLLSSLQKGDEVATAAGVVGRVARVTDDYVVVEVADKMELKFQKQAITAVLPKGTLKAL